MTDTEAMHEALALAREAADEGEVPVGCIVTDGERIVGRVAKQQAMPQEIGLPQDCTNALCSCH